MAKPTVGREDRAERVASHGGFSLVELLIVMALLALVAAMALPSLFGPLDKSRLRGAARDIQKALLNARATAIREGSPLEFRWQPGGRRWTVERTGLAVLRDDSSAVAGLSPELPSTVSAADDLELDRSPGQPHRLREGMISEGATFALETPATEPDATNVDWLAASPTSSLLRDRPVRSDAGWSRPIRFYPNGRSEDAELLIQGSRDFVVRVTLRGLTSAVSYSAPFRRSEALVEETDALGRAIRETSGLSDQGALR